MTDSKILKYQILLLENSGIPIQKCTTLNPATLLPCPEEGAPIYSCEENIYLIYASRRDLRDQALENSERIWFTDGSSFVREGVRHAGYSLGAPFEITGAKALPPGILAQLTKLIVPSRALQLGRNKIINIYTDTPGNKMSFLA